MKIFFALLSLFNIEKNVPPLEPPCLTFVCNLKGTEKGKGKLVPFIPSIYIYPLLLPPVHHLDQYVRGWWVHFCIFENPKRGQDSKPPLPLAVNTWNIQLSKPLIFKDRHYTGIYLYILNLQSALTQYIFTWVSFIYK